MSGGADELLEIERKYEVGADFAVPDLTGLPGVAAVTAPETLELRATYYDTPGRRLASARITLRRRRGGPDEGWHLKLPAGQDTRREIHEPVRPGDEGAVPGRLAALVAAHVEGEPLSPVATIATTRVIRILTGPDGAPLAELADDHVRGALPADPPPGWREAARWREVEVELHGGPPALLEPVEAALARAGARPAALGSKLARLLAAA